MVCNATILTLYTSLFLAIMAALHLLLLKKRETFWFNVVLQKPLRGSEQQKGVGLARKPKEKKKIWI